MSIRISKITCLEFIQYLRQHELTNGQIDVNGIRELARVFALTKYPDHKASQPLYHRCFKYALTCRHIFQTPDDFDDYNPYDPDGLYPHDKNIKKKLKALEKRAGQMADRIIENIAERNNQRNNI